MVFWMRGWGLAIGFWAEGGWGFAIGLFDEGDGMMGSV